MKKTMLACVLVILAVASTGARAEWVRIQSNDKLTAYADSSAIRKKLYIVKVLSLFDFKSEGTLADGSPYLSIIRETEFNCRENLQRMVSFSIQSGKMGKGKVLESGSDPQDWKPVSKESIAAAMREFACGNN